MSSLRELFAPESVATDTALEASRPFMVVVARAARAACPKPQLQFAARTPASVQLTERAGTITQRVCQPLTREGRLNGKNASATAPVLVPAEAHNGIGGPRMNSIADAL